MPWPFSRSEPASSSAGPGETGARQSEARDPAAELRAQTRRRLLGAAVLLLAAVILLPMLLDTAPRPMREDITITVASPPPASMAQAPEVRPPLVDEKIAEPAPVRSESEAIDAATAKSAKASPTASTLQPAIPRQAAPPSQVAPLPAPAPAKERFVVQVAALSSSAAADDLTARLIKGGFSGYVEAVSTAGGTLHRVRVGPFATRDEAQRAVDKLKTAGHKAAVVGG
jgi:DedD protein